MTKNKMISMLFACAAIFSVLAAVLVYHYMSPTRATIYVFNDDYSSGTQITVDMLKPVQVDAQMVSGGKSTSVATTFVTPTDYAQIIRSGDSLRMDVGEGMPLTSAMLSVTGGSKIEMNMKSDSIAVTIPVDSTKGITNALKDGAYVNVYATNGNETKLIQQEVRVLEVFQTDGEISAVALEEDRYGSMELINAETTQSLYLGLVDETGYKPTEGDDPAYIGDASDDSYTYENAPYDTAQTEQKVQEEEETEAESDKVTDKSGVFGS